MICFFHFTYKHSINFFTFSSFFCELIHKLLPTSGEGETETLAMRNEYIHVCFLIHYLLLLLQLRFFNKLTELVIMNVGFLCIASQRLSQAMKWNSTIMVMSDWKSLMLKFNSALAMELLQTVILHLGNVWGANNGEVTRAAMARRTTEYHHHHRKTNAKAATNAQPTGDQHR